MPRGNQLLPAGPNQASRHSALRRAVMTYLRVIFRDRIYLVAIRGGLGTAPGTPDIMGCIDGRFFGIEIKTGKGRLSNAQKEVAHNIDQAGGLIMVIHSIEEAIEAFQPFQARKEQLS